MDFSFVLLFLPIIVACAFIIVLIIYLVKALSIKLSETDNNRNEEKIIKIAPSQAWHQVKDIRFENDSAHYVPISDFYRSYPVVIVVNDESNTQTKAIKLHPFANNERINSMRHAYYPPKESVPKMEVLNVN